MTSMDEVEANPESADRRRDLELLYETEWPKLVRVAYLMTDSASLAEEIAQDAFVRLQEAGSRVRNPGGYLHTSVVNRCRDVHRHRAVVQRSPRRRPEVVIDQHDELFDAMNALSERQQAALILRFHLDLPEHEIADVLNCRPSTVRSLTKRGLAALRKELG